MATYAPNQLNSVPLAELQPDPTQPRKSLNPLALEELTTSVSQDYRTDRLPAGPADWLREWSNDIRMTPSPTTG